MTTFSELGLMPEIQRAVRDARYTTPTPIQSQAIPIVLQGKDILACAQTGTGKTAAFLLPIFQFLSAGDRGTLRALVLTPTRELAAQIQASADVYGRYVEPRSEVIVGGVRLEPQIERLRRRPDLLIATPGRLLDHHQRRNVALSNVNLLVLDEADRMLDMGFLPAVYQILRELSQDRQSLLFCATMPREIERLARETMREAVVIDVGRRATPVSSVTQVVYAVEAGRKRALLCYLLRRDRMTQVLVFTRTKVRADRLAHHLTRTGRRVAALHGGLPQTTRTRTLRSFRSGQIDVLVATDVASRGLDVEGISHVVNFDIPEVPEDYVHRIGRTARASASGDAISLVSAEDVGAVRAIENLVGQPIPRREVRGFEPEVTTRRCFERSSASLAARIASGSVRHYAPRRRSSSWAG